MRKYEGRHAKRQGKLIRERERDRGRKKKRKNVKRKKKKYFDGTRNIPHNVGSIMLMRRN
jgi:hypothetical protein